MHLGNFFKSTLFFSKRLLFRQEYDVVFIYRNTFVRRDGSNHLLQPFVKSCQKHGYRYLLLESRLHQASSGFSYPYSSNAIPFDLISYLQSKLRKYFTLQNMNYDKGQQWYDKEAQVGKVLHKLFFRNLKAKLFVTLAGYEYVTFLKIIYPEALFAEYQHGVSWCQNDPDVLKLHHFYREYLNRETILLLYGERFAKVRARCPEKMAYLHKNLRVIGHYASVPGYIVKQNRKTILYTLQNIDMKSNEDYYWTIKTLIAYNAEFLQQNGYHIFFKNHPRYERDDALVFEEKYPFVSFIGDEEPMNMLDDISIHITSKSTTALDAALYSLPTIFIDMLEIRSPKEIFFNQYHYPLTDFRVEKASDLEGLLRSLEDQEHYGESSRKVYDWGREYYQDFDEQVFLDLIAESKQK